MKSISIKNPKLFIIGFIYTYLLFSKIVVPIPSLSTYAIFAIALCIAGALIVNDPPNLYKPLAFFLIYILLSLLALDPPSVFKVWYRYILFAGMLLISSPLLQNQTFRDLRKYCIKITLAFCIIISTISFFCFFLGINYMQYQAIEIDYIDKGGLFGGITNHSIALGFISGISVCALLQWCLKNKLIYIVSIIPSFGSLMFAASRSAVIATLVGCVVILFYTYKNYKNKRKILEYLITIIIGVSLAISSTDVLDGLKSKQLNRGDASLFSSREDKIECRLEEFKSSPIIGIGFATVDVNGRDYFDQQLGVIEPGSSWFAILSMTGIIGLIFMLTIFYQCFKSNYSQRPITYFQLGLLIYVLTAMISEGYIFAGGSPICAILWLIISQSVDLKYR